MSRSRGSEEYWRNLPPPPEKPGQQEEVLRLPRWSGAGEPCAYARDFLQQGEQIVAQARAKRKHEAINIAKVLLQDRYFEYWNAVPGEHKAQADHRCVTHVYEELYAQLRGLQLDLVPPSFSESPPPAVEEAEEGVPIFGLRKEDYQRHKPLPPLSEEEDDEDSE